MKRSTSRIVCIVGFSVLLCACGASNVIAPLGRAQTRDNVAAAAQGLHRVVAGDSLYSIAWRYALDYRDLSRWNAIPEPYTVHLDQLLRVSRPAVLPRMPPTRKADVTVYARPSQNTSAAPKIKSKPVAAAKRERSRKARPAASASKPKPVAPVPRAKPKPQSQQVVRSWLWPVKGRVIGLFGKAGGKGIDIAGRRGTSIKAAAPGNVVYSGSGLRGYGKLIILKHNKRYLSAYAHNDRLHVKEGDTVKRGQRIAQMGDSGTKSVRLHFEIRRDGKPVDPTRFLPR